MYPQAPEHMVTNSAVVNYDPINKYILPPLIHLEARDDQNQSRVILKRK